jgi:hypothetical protein
VLSKLGFHVYCADLQGVTSAEDVALRLSRAVDKEETDLETVMQLLTGLQERQRFCFIVTSFHASVRLRKLRSRRIEGIMRSYCQSHTNAAWLFLGKRAMLPAFISCERPFFRSGFVYTEEDIFRTDDN